MRDVVEALPEGVRVVREAPTYFLCELDSTNRRSKLCASATPPRTPLPPRKSAFARVSPP